jgi:hypothetical protein
MTVHRDYNAPCRVDVRWYLAGRWATHERLPAVNRQAVDDARLLPVAETRRLLELAMVEGWDW